MKLIGYTDSRHVLYVRLMLCPRRNYRLKLYVDEVKKLDEYGAPHLKSRLSLHTTKVGLGRLATQPISKPFNQSKIGIHRDSGFAHRNYRGLSFFSPVLRGIYHE